ncbi:hypothetical protein [Oceanirhabdus seepicola]|uniref:Uncharacterized protein n=1 Tax=Oceanirhabdus seepicola TaxID=2828781 RepID=A0A9J6NXT6_9CLOT|nr:hypothetical protein [Oceanirhabdus seepicola]MCM1988806.1 hypothetical protein [Oceanirhabdus seepicola]
MFEETNNYIFSTYKKEFVNEFIIQIISTVIAEGMNIDLEQEEIVSKFKKIVRDLKADVNTYFDENDIAAYYFGYYNEIQKESDVLFEWYGHRENIFNIVSKNIWNLREETENPSVKVLKSKIDDFIEKNNELQRAIEEEIKKNLKLEEEASKLQGRLEVSNNKLKDEILKNNELKNQNDSLNKEKTELQEDIYNIKSKLENEMLNNKNLKIKLHESEEKVEEYLKINNSLHLDIKNLSTDKDKLNNTIQKYIEEIKNIKQENMTIVEKNKKLIEWKNKYEASDRDLYEKYRLLNLQNEELKSKINSIEEGLSKEEKLDFEKKIQSINSENEKYKKEIIEKDKKLDKLKENINEKEMKEKQYLDLIEKNKVKQGKVEDRIIQLDDHNIELEKEIERLQSEIKQIKEKEKEITEKDIEELSKELMYLYDKFEDGNNFIVDEEIRSGKEKVITKLNQICDNNLERKEVIRTLYIEVLINTCKYRLKEFWKKEDCELLTEMYTEIKKTLERFLKKFEIQYMFKSEAEVNTILNDGNKRDKAKYKELIDLICEK